MKPSDINDFLARAKARERERNSREGGTRFGRMREDVGYLHRFWIQFIVGCTWVWCNVLRPITHALSWVFTAVFRQYRKLWALSVYRRDQYDNLRLSKTRAGLFIVGTVLAMYFAWNMVNLLYDTTMYLLTAKRDETLYLTSSQEVDAPGNVHAVKGCSELPCSDEDSIYFRINPSGFNHLWSLAHNHAIFFPDYVAAAVPPGTNRCRVTTYGIRVKLLMRGFDLYPELLKASCKPVTVQDTK